MPEVSRLDDECLLIDGKKVFGRIEDSRKCRTCAAAAVYFADYDAVACLQCNTWLDPHCGEPDCPVCSARPERPLPL